MIPKAVILLCLALLCVQGGGETLTVDGDALGHLRRLKQELGRPPLHARGRLPTIQATVDSVAPRRQLKGIDACHWNEDTSTCSVATDVSISLLEKADNPVADYLRRVYHCFQFGGKHNCEANGCIWYDLVCSYTVEDYEQLVSSPCLSSAKNMVRSVEWSLECNEIKDDFACNINDHCYWSETFGCMFDRWTYYFNIQTVNSFPEGFNELFTDRLNQLNEYLIEMYDSSNADESLEEILHATLPKFNCQYGYEDLVCQYVEAISAVEQVKLYCLKKYSSESSCVTDSYCQESTESKVFECTASDEQLLYALYEGEKIFDAAIPDSGARELEEKKLHCAMKDNQYSCTGDCRWSSALGTCSLNAQWVENRLNDLIGDSTDPVCQYFLLPKTTGCIDRDSEFQCLFDEKCYWSVSSDCCMAGMEYGIEMALEASDIACEYRDVAEMCQGADTRRECRNVPDYEEGVNHKMKSSSHSSKSEFHVQVNVQGAEADQQSEGSKSLGKSSSSVLWVLLVPATALLVGGFFAWRYWRSLHQGIASSEYGGATYERVNG